MRASKLALACLAFTACAEQAAVPVAPPPSPPARAEAPAPAARDDGRLPPLARPERYSLSLTVDPREARFSGTTRILSTVLTPTRYLVLHGRNLDVKRAVARAGAAEIPATVTARPAHGGQVNEELLLTFADVLAAGPVTLTFDYDAPFDDSLEGLYHVAEGPAWYAFSQFEATDARRAFPCFDEPGIKVAFDLQITVPKGMIAVANTPETARREAGAQTTFEFATTPPLPTYLVALAVGDLDVREGPRSPVPIRLIATKGKGALGQLAIEAAAGLTRELGDYFQIAYPYPKLDIVAVPNFSAGAMENAGLVTFREELLLIDPAHASVKTKREMTVTVAHELSHQWFGDLVTMAWWNDLWLNEGFATWAEAKISDRFKPGFEARVELVGALADVMTTDSLASARAVRQPVASTSDALEAFDDLTYRKGAAVLSMIEHSIGEAVFQKGVHAYLSKFAWKNATADDLLQALDEASGKDVTSLASSFLDRAGVPKVTLSTACTASGETVSFTQAPWKSLGDATPAKPAAPWWVPLGVTSAIGERAAKLLSRPSDEIHLTRCAPWVFPNTDEAGYYRFSLDEKSWAEMAKGFARLDTVDRVGFLANMWAETRAGELSPDAVLRILPAVDAERDRFVIEREIAILRAIGDALVTDETRPAFKRYVALRLAPHRKALGPAAGPRDDAAVLLQRALTSALGDLTDDDATLKEAAAASLAWLRDPGSVDPDLASIDLTLGSRRAGPERVEALRAAAKNAKTPEDRVTAERALGGFGVENLGKALDVLLTDDVKTQDLFEVLEVAMSSRASRKLTFDWVVSHWEPLRKRMPDFLASALFTLPSYACSRDERTQESDFLRTKVKDAEGAERPLAEALEAASQCEALHDKYTASVTHFFATFAPTPPARPPVAAPPPAKPATPARPNRGAAKKAPPAR